MIQPDSEPRSPAWLPRVPLFVTLIALLWCLPPDATAQGGPSEGNFEKAARLIGEGTRELITLEIEMTAAESERFWQVYERYDEEMKLLGSQYVRLLETFYDRYLRGVLDESEANGMIEEYLALQIGMLRVRQKYLGEFRKVIGGLRTTRLYQLHNQVKAEVDAALAEVVPLVETTQ